MSSIKLLQTLKCCVDARKMLAGSPEIVSIGRRKVMSFSIFIAVRGMIDRPESTYLRNDDLSR